MGTLRTVENVTISNFRALYRGGGLAADAQHGQRSSRRPIPSTTCSASCRPTGKTVIFRLFMLAIAAVGIGLHYLALSTHAELLAKVGDALLIASVLGTAVDSYTKRKLAEDVARDISPYAVGALLPQEARLEIAALLQQEQWRQRAVDLSIML